MNDVTQFWNFWYYKTQRKIKKKNYSHVSELLNMLVGQYYVFPINNIQQCQEFRLVWNCVPNDSYLLFVNLWGKKIKSENKLLSCYIKQCNKAYFRFQVLSCFMANWATIPASSGIDSLYFEKTWKGICIDWSYKTFLTDPKYIAPPRGLLRRPKEPPGKLGR